MSYNVKIFFNSFKCNSLNISTQEIYDLDHFHNYGHRYPCKGGRMTAWLGLLGQGRSTGLRNRTWFIAPSLYR